MESEKEWEGRKPNAQPAQLGQDRQTAVGSPRTDDAKPAPRKKGGAPRIDKNTHRKRLTHHY